MSLFSKIYVTFSIISAISFTVFVVSFLQRENVLRDIYYSRHKVCQLNRIDGAFYLKNDTPYIFSGGYFWTLGQQFNIEDKTPKPIRSVWPEFSGKLLHAFNYGNNAFMIVHNSNQFNTTRKEEVFAVKYNPLRIEKVAQNFRALNIPYVMCFDAITSREMCFYVPELKSNSSELTTEMLTTIENNCLNEKVCATLTFVGQNRLDGPTIGLKKLSFSLGDIQLPIQFDSYLNYQNDIIVIFFGKYYCVKKLSCPSLCRWRPYVNHFCQVPQSFDVLFPIIKFAFGTSVTLIIIFFCRVFVFL